MNAQLKMTYWDVLHHTVILKKGFLGVNTTRETVNFVRPAVANCLHAGSVMIKLVTIPWKGGFYNSVRLGPTNCIDTYDSIFYPFRKATSEMMCMNCCKIQPVGPVCTTPSCDGLSMAKYYCSICKFFDDERYERIWASVC